MAVTGLLPPARLLPFTINAAVAVAPEPASVAVPSVMFPAEKVTLPAGVTLPLAALTVAVNCVVALCAILAGLAASVVAVATGGAVTTTVTEPDDAVKLLLAT